MVEPGQVIDEKYRILRLIGEGGMGAVFEGENVRIHRRVAIKVLHHAALANAETVRRFEREAQAAGRIGSDHILEILDLGTLPDGERYMVMEFLAGETLSSRIRRSGRMPVPQIVPLLRQALVGLGAAHNAGIVHRDLKPDNIFILNEKSGIRDYVKLIDFGISKFNVLGGDMSMTRTGAVMGTPYYMSPEQAKGSSEVDHRSDIYAIGVILYEAATGEVPFTGNTFNELMFKIVLSEPVPLEKVIPEIDPRFAALVTRAMAREPSQRFASTAELIQALDALVVGAPAQGYGAPQGPAPQGFTAQQTPGPEQQRAAFAAASGVRTEGSFATSQQDAPVRPNKSVAGIAAVVGVLVLGGGAFAAYRALSSKGPDAHAGDPPPASAEPARTEPAPQPKVEPAPPAPVETPPVVAAPSSAAAPAEPAPAVSASGAPIAAGGKARIAPAPKRGPAPAPATTKPAPATTAKSSRDFGY